MTVKTPSLFRISVPHLLIAGGLLITLQGARDVWQWRWGQYTAAREFEDATAARVLAESKTEQAVNPQPGDPVAKLSIPRLNTELYVVEGTDAADLRRGPGHLTGTAMPGADGNCVIAGHRDTHFRILRQIHTGDSVILQNEKGRYVYRVKRTQVVSPENTSCLRPAHGVLHLITCYPFSYIGAAPKRMVVEAQLAASE
ncbi:MAG TPA: class D sortase [Bryobacteraceae bacterium]|nr:class D sortase [Bryobacteraceae bacterium]